MENAQKRPLDDDPRETDGDDRKRPKIDGVLKIPPFDDIPIRKVRNPKMWEMLPAIVKELFSLIKSSKAADEKRKKVLEKVSRDTKEELTVLPNQAYEDKCIVPESENSDKDNNNTKINGKNSSLSSGLLSSTISNNVVEEKSVHEILEESKLFTIKTENGEVQVKVTSNVEKNPVTIENNNQKVNPEKNEGSENINVNENNIVPVVGFSLVASTSMPSKIEDKKNDQENSITEDTFGLAKSNKILDILKNICTDDMDKIPTSKPPACVCVHCISVDNLPIKHSAVNQQLKSNTGFRDHSLNRDIYSSSRAVSDCSVCASKGIYVTNDCSCVRLNSNSNCVANTESSRNIWINNLTTLIRKNDEQFNVTKTKNKSSYVKTAISNIKETAQQIKAHIPFCRFCKKFKNSGNSGCMCTQYSNKDNYGRYTKYDRY